MNNINLIDILYKEITLTEADSENYERIAGEACRELYKKVINEIFEEDNKKGRLAEMVILNASERENRLYFELGFRCAMQLRSVGEPEVHYE